MQRLKNFAIALLTLCPFFLVEAEPCCDDYLFRHQFYVGPEIYYLKRTREGGSKQQGCLFGGRLGYDYIRRYAFYFGVEGLYAGGNLDGRNKEHKKLKSTFIDANAEARFGYTFEAKNSYHPSFTPFIGIGYFWEANKFKHPSPLPVHFHNKFTYIPVGFLSRFFVNENLSVGLNFKARFIYEGKVTATHDADCDDSSQTYEEYPQYRVELPISYYFNWCSTDSGVTFEPFYEYRHYGHRANFPFDFLDTKFNLFGVTLKVLYVF